MKCPYCSYPESKVVDSRHSDDGLSIRRRRECLQCQRRFTTYETVESLPIVVVKKDGSRQSFDRNKILNGMLRACEKRQVSLAALETAALDIEQILQNSLEREVSTGQIGELVMERLNRSTRSPMSALPRSTASSRISTASCASLTKFSRKSEAQNLLPYLETYGNSGRSRGKSCIFCKKTLTKRVLCAMITVIKENPAVCPLTRHSCAFAPPFAF